MSTTAKNYQKTKYRSRKQVIQDCLDSGAMSQDEAELLNKAVVKADRAKIQGKMFLDLAPYNALLTKKFEEKVAKGELTEKQQKTLHLIRVANISKPHLDSVAEVRTACEEYIKTTIEDNVGCTLNGLALALGFSVKQLKDIEAGALKTIAKDVIKTYIQIIATNNEMTIASGGSVGAMFLGKNYFHLNDKVEIEHTEKKTEMTDEELKEKYDNLEVVDVIDPQDYQE